MLDTIKGTGIIMAYLHNARGLFSLLFPAENLLHCFEITIAV